MKNSMAFLSIVFFLFGFIHIACEEEVFNADATNQVGNFESNQRGQRGNPPGQNGNGTVGNNTGGESSPEDCTKGNSIDQSRGACTENLNIDANVSITTSGNIKTVQSNNIPSHQVGLFGGGFGSLNPNAIKAQNSVYRITTTPTRAATKTSLLVEGPQYSFGILLNGVELDPVAAEPWPHERGGFSNVNWEWNLEATNVRIGLDCNNAHVQPTGKYHYHGSPMLLLESIQASGNKMSLIGYAADGFPIYYKYGYSDANQVNSAMKELKSSYTLKKGERPGDGINAPCGTYNGVYSNDYEYKAGLGDLDECNGREGVTPEFPNGTYYYVITSDFPSSPRCFVGTPSNDFKIGF